MEYYVIDAFAGRLFSGNPAGVCLLDRPLPERVMQRIAAENNLAETAFLRLDGGEGAAYGLRWFTPEMEMDLCGHATLAAAHVLLCRLGEGRDRVDFDTAAGRLTVEREGERLVLDLPARPPVPHPLPPEGHRLLERALGCQVLETHLSRDLVAVVEDQRTVAGLSADISLLQKLDGDPAFAVAVTAKGEDWDFVSRFFAPGCGIPEDPVTGSAHCTLIPFWSRRLGKRQMLARQLSPRGGVLHCRDCGERVKVGGEAVCYLRGEILLDEAHLGDLDWDNG